MPRITLIGYRGTGKSSVAAAIAARLGCQWTDADVALEKRLGCSIAELVRERGEPAFREQESRLLETLLEECSGVLATGGGVVLADCNRDLLRARARPVVWLTAPAAVIRARLAGDPSTQSRRPALLGGDPLAEVAVVLEQREPLYRQCADAVFDTASASVEEVAAGVARWLADFGAATGRQGGSA